MEVFYGFGFIKLAHCKIAVCFWWWRISPKTQKLQ